MCLMCSGIVFCNSMDFSNTLTESFVAHCTWHLNSMLLSAAVANPLLMIEALDFHSSMQHVPAIIYQQSNQMKVILLGYGYRGVSPQMSGSIYDARTQFLHSHVANTVTECLITVSVCRLTHCARNSVRSKSCHKIYLGIKSISHLWFSCLMFWSGILKHEGIRF